MTRPTRFEIMRANRWEREQAPRRAAVRDRIDRAELDEVRFSIASRPITPPPPLRSGDLGILLRPLPPERPIGLLRRIFGGRR